METYQHFCSFQNNIFSDLINLPHFYYLNLACSSRKQYLFFIDMQNIIGVPVAVFLDSDIGFEHFLRHMIWSLKLE